MVKQVRRGPKKGKRMTKGIQISIILQALTTDSSLKEQIILMKSKGYNVDGKLEKELMDINEHDISFMLANKHIINEIKEETIQNFVKEIKTK